MKKYTGKIMQFTLVTLACICLLFVSTISHKVQAAPTKTTSFDTIDAWQPLGVAALAVGNSEDVSGSYSTSVCIEIAYTHANAQAGVDVYVEVSYATGDDWIPLTHFKGQAVTPNLDDLDEGGGATAGDTSITLTSTTGDYATPGELFFIIDTSVAESEVLRVKSESTNIITLVQDLKYNHVDQEITTDAVDQWIISLPLEAAYVHVLVYNSDADASIHWRSFAIKTSAL